MAAYGDVNWNNLCTTWDDCTSQRVWNCFSGIIQQPRGGTEESYDWLDKKNLTLNERQNIISLYVEVFKDHLSGEEKSLLERAGIKLTYIDKVEVNEAIDVVLKTKKIVTENTDKSISTSNKIADAKAETIGLEELMKILKIK